MMFSLYILECADKTLYVGHTDDLDERMRQHDEGKVDAYTASRHPLSSSTSRSSRRATKP
jgi:predicted GIY-YIG superfamily endonuclease